MWGTIGYCLLSYYFGFYTFMYFMIKPNQKLLTDGEENTNNKNETTQNIMRNYRDGAVRNHIPVKTISIKSQDYVRI